MNCQILFSEKKKQKKKKKTLSTCHLLNWPRELDGLTHNMSITTAADAILIFFFISFQRK